MTLSRVLANTSRAARPAFTLTLLTLLSTAACSSSSDGKTPDPAVPGSPQQERGVEATPPAPVGEGSGTEVNPYGVPYPTQNLGFVARAGKRPGNIIRNYKFLGYRDGDVSKGKQVISLADFFDPEMKEHKLIHFSAGALWCPPCNEEAEVLVPLVSSGTLKTKKVLVIQAIIEGNTRGKGSTLADLDEWKTRHGINFTFFTDPQQQNLGQFFDAAAVPWNAFIDARSMELLTSGTGFSGNIQGEYDRWATWIDQNPAQTTAVQ